MDTWDRPVLDDGELSEPQTRSLEADLDLGLDDLPLPLAPCLCSLRCFGIGEGERLLVAAGKSTHDQRRPSACAAFNVSPSSSKDATAEFVIEGRGSLEPGLSNTSGAGERRFSERCGLFPDRGCCFSFSFCTTSRGITTLKT